MATLFRKTVARPIPANAEVFTKTVDGQATEFARWKVKRNGKTETRTGRIKTTKSGNRRVLMKSPNWIARYRNADGYTVDESTGCTKKENAAEVLRTWTKRAEDIRSGRLSDRDAEITDYQNIRLADHIADYIDDLKARGINAQRVKTSQNYLQDDAAGCRFRWLRDLDAGTLRKWLRKDAGMSAATYNWHAKLWTAFGWWLVGKRLEGKRSSMTGERRIASNPFDGFGLKDESQDRRREARAVTVDELQRLFETARRRPLDDALTIRTGPRKGERGATIRPRRRVKLLKLGHERALIYKTALLTGLRANELRTLTVGDLSFGDVPFLKLVRSNEKNRRGSTIPLKSDLAFDLASWVDGRPAADPVFEVPSGLLRILNRDLVAAGIDKIDELGRRVHIHALRHSTGTHLSAAGVSPRTAQAVMRHSNINLTMNTYTDERLLDQAGAVERLPTIPLGGDDQSGTDEPPTPALDRGTGTADGAKFVPLPVPLKSGNGCQNVANLANGEGCDGATPETKKARDLRAETAFSGSRDDKIRTCDLCTPSAAL
ncbi:integrase-recombinase protein [Rhodopirellula sallentina SM41]|uniref:Integrase-recombinase protein n=1 Tax=Rhodopirellula sallentina SM41 TaxID=1263870 RepID=M5U9Y1_9BACT|nr:integrase-recombinase protein [Rhodopirellula sallentina SM41]